jgi:hypothetical protein
VQPVAVVHPLLVASRQAVPAPQQAVPPVVQGWCRTVQASQLQEADDVPQAAPSVARPAVVSKQVSPEQQGLVLEQEDWTAPQVPQVPELHARPMQHGLVGEQLAATDPQESQTQEVSPAGHGWAPLEEMQLSVGEAVQQLASVVQAWYCALQVGGTAQAPATQVSVGLLQQSAPVTQLPPVGAQALTALQMPLVAPGRIEQERPVQQSPSAVQEPLVEAHGGAQTSPTQLFEQHSLATVQRRPLALQVAGTSQLKALPPNVQTVPEQQLGSSAPVQAAWSAAQVGRVHRSTPSAPGTQGAKLQH